MVLCTRTVATYRHAILAEVVFFPSTRATSILAEKENSIPCPSRRAAYPNVRVNLCVSAMITLHFFFFFLSVVCLIFGRGRRQVVCIEKFCSDDNPAKYPPTTSGDYLKDKYLVTHQEFKGNQEHA